MDVFLSIVVPLYNENERLRLNGPRIHEFFSKLDCGGGNVELIFVDDGSQDDTLNILNGFKRLSSADNVLVKIISYEKNRGKGYALKQGVKQAVGQYIFFTDIDLSTPLSFFHALYNEIQKGYPVVIGSRSIKGSKITIPQPSIRKFLGGNYYKLLRMLFSMDIKDTNCGFKMFSARHGKPIFDAMVSERWAFDFESLYLARKYGLSIKEVPVEWEDDSDSRVRPFYDSAYTMFELLKIKHRDMFGMYPHYVVLPENLPVAKDRS